MKCQECLRHCEKKQTNFIIFQQSSENSIFPFLLITKSLRGDKIKASNDALKRLRSISFLLLKDFSSNSPLDWPQRFTYVGCGTNRGLESRIRSILLPWPWRSSKRVCCWKTFPSIRQNVWSFCINQTSCILHWNNLDFWEGGRRKARPIETAYQTT